MNTPKVLIVGAGIGGLTAAIALRANGIDVEVYEAAAQQRSSWDGAGAGQQRYQGAARTRYRSGGGRLRASIGMLRAAHCPRQIDSLTARSGDHRRTRRSDSQHPPQRPDADVAEGGRRPVDPLRRRGRRFRNRCGGVSVTCADGRTTHADVLIGADGIRSIVRAKLAGEVQPVEYGYVCWLATTPFSHPRMVRGYCGHYWGKGQRFGLIDIGGGTAYWWGTKNMPAAQGARVARREGGDTRRLRRLGPRSAAAIARTPAR